MGGRRTQAEGLRPFGLPIKAAALYGGFYGLLFAYFHLRWPDWAYGYLVDPAALPEPVGYLAYLSCLVVASGAGALITSAILAQEGYPFAIILTVWACLIWILVFNLMDEPYNNVTTYSAFHQGERPGRPQEFTRLFMFLGMGQFLLALGISGRIIKDNRRFVKDHPPKK